MIYYLVVIDWLSVIMNSSWILGLSILLATFSYYHWQAAEEQMRFNEKLNESFPLKLLLIGLLFIGIGLMGTSQNYSEAALWFIVFIFLFIIFISKIREATTK